MITRLAELDDILRSKDWRIEIYRGFEPRRRWIVKVTDNTDGVVLVDLSADCDDDLVEAIDSALFHARMKR